MMTFRANTFISIIIPTFNRANLLLETINSVRAQTFDNFECLVVDDGSTDDTETIVNQIIQGDARIKYYKRPSTMLKGANSCRNFGFEQSKGDFIKWLDSDDVITSDCLERQIDQLVGKSYDVCFSQTGFFRTTDNNQIVTIENKVWGRLRPFDNLIDDHLKGSIRWQTGAGLWRRVYLDAKPYLEGLMNSQEWLMHFKFITRNVRIIFIDESLCLARIHDGSMSHRNNKRSAYYFNQCVARNEALRYLEASKILTRSRALKLLKSFSWNHLFVAYKGGPWKALQLVPKYFPFIGAAFFASKQPAKTA